MLLYQILAFTIYGKIFLKCYAKAINFRDRVFVNGYGFLSFTKNIGQNIVENISKNLSGKSIHKLPGHTKQSTTDVLKTVSKRVIQETDDLIGNKIANRITNV